MERFVDLKSHNTFGLPLVASHYASIHSRQEVYELLGHPVFKTNKLLILGGGSNLLFLDDFFDGLIIQLNNSGWNVIGEEEDRVLVKACAGTDWTQFVDDMVEIGFHGLENLSLIPGKVGAAPMQNIGAYGVELKDSFYQLEAIDLKHGTTKIFDKKSCDFGYRSSVFKHSAKGRYLIVSVSFALRKKAVLNTSYGNLASHISASGIANPDIKTLSEAVKNIRRSKLPDPSMIGNAGSFFKNPLIVKRKMDELLKDFPQLPSFPAGHNTCKIPAAWLIEQAGWKAYRNGDAGVHDKQALVLVNHGNATGREIFALAMQIQLDVKQKFGIQLEPEVNII